MNAKPPEPVMQFGQPDSWLQRRRLGAVALALIGLLAVLRLRGSCEPLLGIGLEIAIQLLTLSMWFTMIHPLQGWFKLPTHKSYKSRTSTPGGDSQTLIFGGLMVVNPWCLQAVLRLTGLGTGLELIAMSSFAWATVFSVLCAKRRRALGTSVVCSGFLTLLATCSSDTSVALVFALLWGGLCLWWLASSQWERAERCQVNTVVDNHWQRPIIVVAGCLVFAMAAWSVTGRFPAARRLPWQVAPTSGGSGDTDEFARAGVGDGDALVAARENAASFGAVDSDLMLDSQEASLFDLYSDSFGEPVRKQENERTVALSSQQTEVSQPAQMAQSDGAAAALTTQRRAGQPLKTVSNRASDALLFWIGRADMHLALERFSNFDGLQWHAAQPQSLSGAPPRPPSINQLSNQLSNQPVDNRHARMICPAPVGNHTWFSIGPTVSTTNHQSCIYNGSLPEAVKFARLRSPRLPLAAGMQSWHVHQVHDSSFFHADEDDNLSMPGRKSVPEFTIVRYINREIDLQTLARTTKATTKDSHCLSAEDNAEAASPPASLTGQQLARATLRGWLDEIGDASPWDTITQLLQKLRDQFRLDRSLDTSTSPDPLADFFAQRSGNDLMFATAASCLLRELGYETRLVTGFVARAENRLGLGQELAIYAQDTHAWLEFQTETGEWIPLEPSPGYPLPLYRISWRYWLSLHAWKLTWALSSVLAVAGIAWWRRTFMFDCACQLVAWAWWFGNDRQRCRWLLAILDCRSRLAGYARPAHISPQRWYATLGQAPESFVSATIAQSTRIFFSEADRLWFGNHSGLSEAGRLAARILWNQSTCQVLQRAMSSSKPLQESFTGQMQNHDC